MNECRGTPEVSLRKGVRLLYGSVRPFHGVCYAGFRCATVRGPAHRAIVPVRGTGRRHQRGKGNCRFPMADCRLAEGEGIVDAGHPIDASSASEWQLGLRRSSPRGSHSTARGRAKRRPGYAAVDGPSPEGAQHLWETVVAPLQGLRALCDSNPGRRFALPWATESEPFGLPNESVERPPRSDLRQ